MRACHFMSALRAAPPCSLALMPAAHFHIFAATFVQAHCCRGCMKIVTYRVAMDVLSAHIVMLPCCMRVGGGRANACLARASLPLCCLKLYFHQPCQSANR